MFPHNLFALVLRSDAAFEAEVVNPCGAVSRVEGQKISIFGAALSMLTLAVTVTLPAQAAVASGTVTPPTMPSVAAVRSPLTAAPNALRGAALAEHHGLLYLTGGDAKGASRGHVDRFDPATGTWTRLTDAVLPRAFGGAEVVGDWLVIVGGRSDVGPEPTTELVHVVTGEVVEAAPIPTPRWNAGVTVYQGRVVVGGGTHGWARLDVVEAYDLDTDRWFILPPLNVARDAGLAVVDGSLYAIAGYGGEGIGPTRVVERFDGRKFVLEAALAMPMSAFALAVDHGRIVLFGDFASASRVVAYTPKTRRTELVSTTFTPRRQAAATTTSRGIVVVGGRTDAGLLSAAVERFAFASPPDATR